MPIFKIYFDNVHNICPLGLCASHPIKNISVLESNLEEEFDWFQMKLQIRLYCNHSSVQFCEAQLVDRLQTESWGFTELLTTVHCQLGMIKNWLKIKQQTQLVMAFIDRVHEGPSYLHGEYSALMITVMMMTV